jgi:hypothetical protein
MAAVISDLRTLSRRLPKDVKETDQPYLMVRAQLVKKFRAICGTNEEINCCVLKSAVIYCARPD